MTDTETLVHQRLAQESEDMFERNLSLWAMKRQKIQIIADGYAISGYLAGLDEYWVQVWGCEDHLDSTSNSSFHLISKESITMISPTGTSTKDLNEKEAEEIENKVKNFGNVSYAFNKSLREDKDKDKEGKNARTMGDTE